MLRMLAESRARRAIALRALQDYRAHIARAGVTDLRRLTGRASAVAPYVRLLGVERTLRVYRLALEVIATLETERKLRAG